MSNANKSWAEELLFHDEDFGISIISSFSKRMSVISVLTFCEAGKEERICFMKMEKKKKNM
uniref:Uncharacterized protein n=1 Tax=Onchocerca volvulus TaxID=6282 RepID=A0A8R1TNP1_ONCVO